MQAQRVAGLDCGVIYRCKWVKRTPILQCRIIYYNARGVAVESRNPIPTLEIGRFLIDTESQNNPWLSALNDTESQ